jgi:hypothetical protein
MSYAQLALTKAPAIDNEPMVRAILLLSFLAVSDDQEVS